MQIYGRYARPLASAAPPGAEGGAAPLGPRAGSEAASGEPGEARLPAGWAREAWLWASRCRSRGFESLIGSRGPGAPVLCSTCWAVAFVVSVLKTSSLGSRHLPSWCVCLCGGGGLTCGRWSCTTRREPQEWPAVPPGLPQ